jgi:serine phosphatase RsbU (regulator of sigma subunit)
MKRITLSVVVLFSILNGKDPYAQNNKIDSLWKVFIHAKHDTTRVRIYLEIGSKFERKNPDSAIVYYKKALDIADISYNRLSGSLEHNKTDKLKNTLAIQKSKCFYSLGILYSNQLKYNNSNEYLLGAIKISEDLIKSSENENASVRSSMSICYKILGNNQFFQRNYDNAIEFYLESIKINEELGKSKNKSVMISARNEMSTCLNNIGCVYIDQGNYSNAIEVFLKSLRICEELTSSTDKSVVNEGKEGMANCCTNIGIVYKELDNFDLSNDYLFKAIKVFKELALEVGLAACYNNIGNNYMEKGALSLSKDKNDAAILNYNHAIEFYLKSLKINEELGNKLHTSQNIHNIGSIHSERGNLFVKMGNKDQAQKDYDTASISFNKALKIQEEIGDLEGKSLLLIDMANFYIRLYKLAFQEKEVDKERMYLLASAEYGHKGLKLANQIGAVPIQNEAAASLQKAYTLSGNYKEALQYAEIYISTRDSMFSKEKTKALTEMQVKYESEKKQLQIEKMAKQKELDSKTIEAQQAENRKQQVIMFSTIGGLLIVVMFSLIIFRMFQQKRAANILLAEQNAEIIEQKEEISSQRDEIENQRDALSQQNIVLTEQKKEITDSIRYAKRIQSALLPDEKAAGNLLGDHFILFKPKDIVSGDFYWSTRINDWLIITVADCTGHGVPGAFMSMLGISFLNEIVRKKETTTANEILENLRVEIIEALQQKGTSGEQKDGMDMALCVVNNATNEVQFCGANNSLFILSATNGVQEICPDKMPVAIHENMKPFTNHIINVNKGDILYLLSDGYEDQFGGPNDKKFKINQLKNLLNSIYDKPMDEQKNILDTTFENWKGVHDQTDDVTVLGIKIG